ncbi:hypothetical protein CYY_003213 [Polysphondylium violaceum]|uniref:Exportin-1/Importin-beta-like domain-containing protein n=1 Tax=Polysphondylium violaceum TaxID=133409 RepID=A0A8J4Q021_9MYCE|nr:hypothetical protein CYY_003213 [Polysphondylium violaceum]
MNYQIAAQQQQQQPIDESHFTYESVQNALYSFYFPQNQDFSNIQMTQNWLILFQSSSAAWDIAPMLLSSQVKEIQYFGASTIEAKVKNSWLSLSTETKFKLLENILFILRSGNNNLSNIAITRLCLAVSIISCHSTPELWNSPISDVIQFVFPDINNLDNFNYNQINLMLELLTVFPEELLNSDYITQEKRHKVGIEFHKYYSKIIQILCKILSFPINSNTTIYMKNTLKCFKSWILFDSPAKEYLIEQPLVMLCFESVSKNPMLVEETVQLLDDLFTFMRGKIFKQYPSSFIVILEKILIILPQYYYLALQEDNEHISSQIFLLFSHIAENHIKLLHSPQSTKVSEQFFVTLIEMAKRGSVDICDLLTPIVSEFHSLHENDVDISKWYPILLDFVEIFRLKSMYPVSEQDLKEMDSERFFHFRSVAGDTSLEIFTIIENQTLEYLLNRLWNDIQSFPNISWQSIEATVFLLGSLSEGISEDATSFLPQLFTLLGQLPIQSTPLIKSTIVLAGKYANLMEKTSQFLEKIVGDFIPAFSNPDLKGVASKAFLSISKNEKCALLLAPNIGTLINLCTPIIVKNKSITNDESDLKIMKSLLYITSALTSTVDISRYTSLLLTPYILLIRDYSNISEPQSNDKALLLSCIKLLTDFCKIFDLSAPSSAPKYDEFNNPIIPIVNHLVPIYGVLLKLYYNDNDVVEAISLFYKTSMLMCKPSSNIPEIFKQLTQVFIVNPLSPILNALSLSMANLTTDKYLDFLHDSLSSITTTVIDIWKRNKSKTKLLKISDQTIEKQNGNNNNNDNNNNNNSNGNHSSNNNNSDNNGRGIYYKYNLAMYPQLTKEYFSLINQYFNYNVASIPLWIIPPAFQIPLDNILTISDKTTASACFNFLANFITKSVEKKDVASWVNLKNQIDSLLNQNIEYLVQQILLAIGGGSPRSILYYISDVLYSLVSSYPVIFRPIAIRLFEIQGFPSTNISAEQKTKFLNLVMRHKNKTLFKQAVKDFSLISLGISTDRL